MSSDGKQLGGESDWIKGQVFAEWSDNVNWEAGIFAKC